jgi:hypothetical protein
MSLEAGWRHASACAWDAAAAEPLGGGMGAADRHQPPCDGPCIAPCNALAADAPADGSGHATPHPLGCGGRCMHEGRRGADALALGVQVAPARAASAVLRAASAVPALPARFAARAG